MLTHIHTHSNIPRWDTPREQDDCVKEGGVLYLKWNAGLQGALWHTGDREQGEVHGDTLGAHREHGLLSLRKEAQDIDRVSPYKLLRLPRSAVQVRRGDLMAQVNKGRLSEVLLS